MGKKTEALTKALEAMEKTTYTFLDTEGSHGLQEQETIEQVYKAITALRTALAEQPAEQEPVAWRELCRRLYVELFHCDKQMTETLDADGEPMWTQGKTVRDALADAKAALDTSPPASKPWVNPSIKEYEDIMLANITPRTNDERDGIMGALSDMVVLLQEKNT